MSDEMAEQLGRAECTIIDLRSRLSALEAENGTLKVRISELERTQ